MMKEWGETERRSILAFLRRVQDVSVRWLSEEARSLLRFLDPPTSLPPETDEDREVISSETWKTSEERLMRRKVVVAQLVRAPKNMLPASEISIPGITDRTAKAKFLARCVNDGMLDRIAGKTPLYKLNPAPVR